jgi:hypothetical protein
MVAPLWDILETGRLCPAARTEPTQPSRDRFRRHRAPNRQWCGWITPTNVITEPGELNPARRGQLPGRSGSHILTHSDRMVIPGGPHNRAFRVLVGVITTACRVCAGKGVHQPSGNSCYVKLGVGPVTYRDTAGFLIAHVLLRLTWVPVEFIMDHS